MDDDKAISLATSKQELEDRLLSETNIDDLQNIINIFNLNIKKKDILRTSKLSDLQDLVFEQMQERLSQNAHAFSNKDLLDYFKVVQDTINKTDKTLNDVDVNSIQITQNQLNVNIDDNKLTRESRAKVLDTVNAILNKTKTEQIEKDAIDVTFEIEGKI